MIKFREKAGTARLFVAALSASLIALAVYLYVDSTDTSGAGGEAWPPIAEAVNSRSEADALVHRLNSHLEKRPRDARAWAILARLQSGTDHFAEAARAYEKALALPSKVANDPSVWCEYADALGMTQEGHLAGRPRELIARALVIDPNHPKALEMAGSAEYAQGDYASALRFWRPLLAALQPGSQAYGELATAIARAERLALMTTPPPGR